MVQETQTLVIGAGLAGLTVAAGLARAGADVLVLEKSRGLGGRLATRRAGDLRFDHGAQYVRPRSPEFARYLAGLGLAAGEWTAIDGGGSLVGVPGMSALAKPLAEGVRVMNDVEITGAARRDDRWVVTDADGAQRARAARLVLAIPAPQAARLLVDHPLGRQLEAVVFDPCWTLMVAFDARPDLPETARDPGAPIAWFARDSGKPGRDADAETWVAQAGADWSRTHLENEKETAAALLLKELAAVAGGSLPDIVFSAAHRWRFSQASVPLGQPCMSAPEDGLVIAGDWCLGARAEHAWLSGQAALATLDAVAVG